MLSRFIIESVCLYRYAGTLYARSTQDATLVRVRSKESSHPLSAGLTELAAWAALQVRQTCLPANGLQRSSADNPTGGLPLDRAPPANRYCPKRRHPLDWAAPADSAWPRLSRLGRELISASPDLRYRGCHSDSRFASSRLAQLLCWSRWFGLSSLVGDTSDRERDGVIRSLHARLRTGADKGRVAPVGRRHR
jgi:hypothetical protein